MSNKNRQRSNYWLRGSSRNGLMGSELSRRRLLGLGLVAGAGLGTTLLVGCGDDDDDATPAGSAQPSSAPAVRRGGKLIAGFAQDVSTLDPAVGVSGYDANYLHTIYDSLVGYDHEFKSDANRSLAQSWEVQDQLTITFHLREAKFHDGSPVDAETVKWNIDRVLAPDTKAQNRAQLLVIDQMLTPDPKTLVFKLKSPAADIMSTLGSRGSLIVSRAAFEKSSSSFGNNPVGSGPFRFKGRVVGSSVTVERNQEYWGRDPDGGQYPYLDELEMRYIQDGTARAAAIRAGDVQFVEPAAKDVAPFRRDGDYEVVSLKGGRPGHVLQYNYARAPMDDVNLRAAIAWAEDSRAIVDGAFFGEADVAMGGFWPPQLWAYAEVPNHPVFDLNKAKEYLGKSKYRGETIKLVTYTVPEQVQAIQILQANLEKLGVKSDIVTGDIGQIAAGHFNGESGSHIFSSSFGLYPEPNHIAQNVFSSQGSQNAGALLGAGQDKDIDDLVAKGRTVYETEERRKIYTELNKLVTERAKPTVVLVYQKQSVVGSAKIANLPSVMIADGWLRFHQLSMKA